MRRGQRGEAFLQLLQQGVEIRQDAAGQWVPLDDIVRVARYVARQGCLVPGRPLGKLATHEEYHYSMLLGVYES